MAKKEFVTVEGADVLLAQFLALEQTMRGPILNNATEDAIGILEKGMEAVAPRDTGKLASEPGIVKEKQREEELVAEWAVGPSKDAFYGRFQELGWQSGGTYHPPQPFMRPTYDMEKDNVVDRVGQVLRRAMRLFGVR